jgi:hypothetical protein
MDQRGLFYVNDAFYSDESVLLLLVRKTLHRKSQSIFSHVCIAQLVDRLI